MTQILKDSIKIEYKLDQVTPISKYEMNAYNVPFAGNTSMCREVFVKGERKLEFSIDGDMSLSKIMQKPVFRDELVEYIFSISKQLVSVIQNGLAPEKVVWDTNYMYVRFSDFSIQLLYLPFESKFDKKDIGEFVKSILSGFVYAHTPAIECANQIVDYFNDHREFDAFHFNEFVSDLRASSQLLIIQGEKGKSKVLTSNDNNKELAIHKAEEAARKAEEARMQAENEVKRQIEEAKYQAEVARQAEETRMKAEAARVEAEIWRQKVTAEAKDYEQTAVLTAQDMYSYQGNSDDSERLKAEEMFRNAEEERIRAEKVSSQYADEIRRAREQERLECRQNLQPARMLRRLRDRQALQSSRRRKPRDSASSRMRSHLQHCSATEHLSQAASRPSPERLRVRAFRLINRYSVLARLIRVLTIR